MRPAGPADEALLRALFVDARPELAALGSLPDLVDAQRTAQRASYLARYPAAVDHVIQRRGEPVGRCWTSTSADELRLLDLAVLSAHRRAGIGRSVLRELCTQAAAAGLPLRLSVWSANGAARALYADAGFRPGPGAVNGAGYVALSWWPARVAAGAG